MDEYYIATIHESESTTIQNSLRNVAISGHHERENQSSLNCLPVFNFPTIYCVDGMQAFFNET